MAKAREAIRENMKTYNHLFEKIVDEENIRNAVIKAARGKRKKASVRKALKNIDAVVKNLSEQLKNGTWRPVEVHQTKQINDGVELKKRYIVCPNFVREQCVHHAILNICEPLFRRRFYRYSCGSVKNRGADQVREYIRKMVSRYPSKTKYVVKMDIKKFFHNAPPSFIFREIRRVIRDKRVLNLFALILRSNAQIVDKTVLRRGIPIGFYTSPHFANILLDRIDHYIKEEFGIKVYVRYMDDIIMFDPNRRKLKAACIKIREYVQKMHMDVKPVWQVHRFVCVNFLGYQFKRGITRLRDRIFLKAKRLFKRIWAKEKMTIHDCLRALSYVGRFKKADAQAAFRIYVSPFLNVRELRTRVSKFYKTKGLKYAF